MSKKAVVEIPVEITIKYINIQSLIDGHVIYNGRETDKHYEWVRSGAIVAVDERDVPELLSKRLGGTLCCGADRDGNKIFQIVGD